MASLVTECHLASRDSRAVVLVNPHAGGGRAASYAGRVQSLFQDLRFPAEFRNCRTAGELAEHVQREAAKGCQCFIALGGDGTFQALANAAFGLDAVLAVLPAGSGNDFAAALGLPNDPLRAAAMVVQGVVRSVDLARARFADSTARIYAGGGGVGLDAEAARHASGSLSRVAGRSRYLASALRALLHYESISVHLEFPGSLSQEIEEKALLVGVLNTPTYGAGLRLAPDAAIEDGLLDVVLIEDLPILRTLALLPRLLCSGELRTPRTRRWRVPRVRIAAYRESPFHGDGEILGSAPVEVEALPRAIRVLAPHLGPASFRERTASLQGASL